MERRQSFFDEDSSMWETMASQCVADNRYCESPVEVISSSRSTQSTSYMDICIEPPIDKWDKVISKLQEVCQRTRDRLQEDCPAAVPFPSRRMNRMDSRTDSCDPYNQDVIQEYKEFARSLIQRIFLLIHERIQLIVYKTPLRPTHSLLNQVRDVHGAINDLKLVVRQLLQRDNNSREMRALYKDIRRLFCLLSLNSEERLFLEKTAVPCDDHIAPVLESKADLDQFFCKLSAYDFKLKVVETALVSFLKVESILAKKDSSLNGSRSLSRCTFSDNSFHKPHSPRPITSTPKTLRRRIEDIELDTHPETIDRAPSIRDIDIQQVFEQFQLSSSDGCEVPDEPVFNDDFPECHSPNENLCYQGDEDLIDLNNWEDNELLMPEQQNECNIPTLADLLDPCELSRSPELKLATVSYTQEPKELCLPTEFPPTESLQSSQSSQTSTTATSAVRLLPSQSSQTNSTTTNEVTSINCMIAPPRCSEFKEKQRKRIKLKTNRCFLKELKGTEIQSLEHAKFYFPNWSPTLILMKTGVSTSFSIRIPECSHQIHGTRSISVPRKKKIWVTMETCCYTTQMLIQSEKVVKCYYMSKGNNNTKRECCVAQNMERFWNCITSNVVSTFSQFVTVSCDVY